MCGIAGIVSTKDPIDNHLQLAQLMQNAIFHRGPDSQSCWIDDSKRLLLVHCRLAIQDLSPLGHQPMTSSSGRYTIIYNGEMYNFQSIASELTDLGVTFRGSSDTEVLLEAFERWGISNTISRCNGMFAFALWDSKDKVLTLARDRMGEKPLYYGVIRGELYFASELKSIYALQPPASLAIDKAALASYLRFGYISAPQTIFKEIKKLEPGCLITLNLEQHHNVESLQEQLSNTNVVTKFWSLDDRRQVASNQRLDEESQAVDELDCLLNKIISGQCTADVPLGTFLSGGIDSSVVSAIVQANSNTPIDTFTIGFHDKNFNEAEHAKRVASHIGSIHHETYVSASDVLQVVPSLPELYDEPFADSSQIPMYLVSKLAKKTVTVCLSGDGGDELFAGYNRYCATESAYNKIQRVPRPFRLLASKLISASPPALWDSLYQLNNSLLRKKGAANAGLKIQKLGELSQFSSLADTYKYLSGYWQEPELIIKDAAIEPNLECEGSFETDFIETAMLWDQHYYLPGDNLVKSDRASMAASLEMRLPLLGHELVEFSWRVPPSMKFKDGKSKWLLREVLYRYVPKDIIERPKMGFTVPIAHWLRHELKEWALSLLRPDYLDKQGVFNNEPIQKTLNQHLSGRYDHSHKLWTLLMFQSWYQHFIEE